MKFKLSEREILVAAGAGVTAALAVKLGLLARIPAVGPITPPIGAIVIGVALSAFVDLSGSAGDVVEGVGYGLIAAGAIALG